MHILTAFLALLAAQVANAQETTMPEPQDVRGLMHSLMDAQVEDIFLVDTVRESCAKINSGLVQRGVVYFRIENPSVGSNFVYGRSTLDRSESGEVRKSGAVLYRRLLSFDTETERGAAATILGQCDLNPDPVHLEVTSVVRDAGEAVIWKTRPASGFCKRPWLNEDCVLGCSEYVDRGTEVIVFAKGLTGAHQVMQEAGFMAHCGS